MLSQMGQHDSNWVSGCSKHIDSLGVLKEKKSAQKHIFVGETEWQIKLEVSLP